MTNLRRSVLALAIAVTAACNAPPPAAVSCASPTAATPPNAFTVVGTATLDVEPDTADLHVTVSAQASKPGAATKTARARQQKLVASMVGLGIEERDIKLALLQISPVWDEKYTHVVAYQAAISLTASTHDFDQIGAMMEVAADAGATEISSSFHADLPTLKRKVRDLALAAAKDKAAQISTSLGVTLGKIIAIDEGGANPYGYYNQTVANVQVAEPSPATSSTSAELQPLTLSISVTYLLA